MRTIKLAVALLAVLGWAVPAHAGPVKKTYNVSDFYGSTARTHTYGLALTFTASVISGTLSASISTPNSTFSESVTPNSAWVHMRPSGMIKAKGKLTGVAWTVSLTLLLHVQGSTLCHLGTGGVIPASCHLEGLNVTTIEGCDGKHTFFSGNGCEGGIAPGCWLGENTHTQMFENKSVHCGQIKLSQTASGAHYFKSCQAKLVPPVGHSCQSMSTMPHLASSDPGYHLFHIRAKQK